jgi:Bacterial regulatory proteins, tetR family
MPLQPAAILNEGNVILWLDADPRTVSQFANCWGSWRATGTMSVDQNLQPVRDDSGIGPAQLHVFWLDGVSVREITAGTGVTAMLVNWYFGSKEQHFAEFVTDTMRPRGTFTGDITTRNRSLATFSGDVAAVLIVNDK